MGHFNQIVWEHKQPEKNNKDGINNGNLGCVTEKLEV